MGEGVQQLPTEEDEYRHQGEEADEVYVVTIPRNLHHTKPVLEAKRKELENFKIFKVYEDACGHIQKKKILELICVFRSGGSLRITCESHTYL